MRSVGAYWTASVQQVYLPTRLALIRPDLLSRPVQQSANSSRMCPRTCLGRRRLSFRRPFSLYDSPSTLNFRFQRRSTFPLRLIFAFGALNLTGSEVYVVPPSQHVTHTRDRYLVT